MRTALAALAALAAVTSSMAAVPAFLKSSCGSMSSNAHTADLMGVANGEWSCVDFSAAAASQQLVKLDMANRWYGYTLQVMLWNSGRTAGAANALIWANSAAGRNVLEWIKPQNGQKDVNALPEAHNARYSNISTPITLAATTGWTGDVDGYRNNGVYALTTDVMPNPGRNTFIIKNPYDDASTTGAAAFAGAFMYRLVDASVANNVYGGLSAEVVSAHWGQLAMNSPVTVSNVLMPGSSFTVPVSAGWATQGFALKGLSYTVSISPGGSSGTVASARMGWGSPAVPNGLPPPNGYGTTDDMERSFRYVSPGSQFIPGPFSQTADGQNMWYDYSAMWGPHNGTQTYSSSANSITKTWNYPVDVKDASAAGFGYIVVSIPEVQNQYDATVSPYDWSSQTSPFWDVTVTINTATEYPLLGSESNVELVNKNNMPVDGHNAASPATDPAMGPYKIYRVGTSNPLWWRMIVNMNTVTNKNLPTGVTEEGVGCMPNWDYQIVQDPNSAHGENGWGETWHNLQSSATGYNAEDFWASNADAKISKLSTAKGWLTTNLWRSGRELPGAANGALLPKINTGRGTWMMVRISATMAAVDSGVKTCGSDHVSIGSLSASWDTVDDQCSDYTDCSPMAADNPNAGQQSDSANVNSRRFSNCVVAQKPGANYRFMPFTKCVECFSSAQCGTGQYCHTDAGTASITWGSYAGAYTVDSSSAKLVGLCRHKSPDVLGKRCRLLSQDSGSTGATATTYFPTLSSTPVDLNFGSAISNAGPAQYTTQVAAKGDATNPEFAKGAYGACGEYRYMESGMPGASTLAGPRPFVNTAAGSGWVRIALWEGFCDADQICRECVPGDATTLTTGQVCLNGHAFNAMDVDNTVRTFAQNTNVGTALGTTGMIILLIILFAAYMYTEATRWRHTNGLPPMTCCECLCCCGCCSKLGAATATATKNPAVAA